MGVIGLTSLVEVNPHLLSAIELRDTRLIVDGNSFCYQLFNISRIDSRFGGDYPKFESLIQDRLDNFHSCGIRPIFIFDGLLDVGELKRATALLRQKTRLHTAKLLSSSSSDSGAKLLPPFAHDVLIRTLKSRCIETYRCAGEADAIAVGLANDRGAPLLSLDSDFFIFDLKHGYIPFDTVEWNVRRSTEATEKQSHSKNGNYLPAKLYRLDNLLEHYPTVDRRLLPLFAFLCGNDFSSGCSMDKFFDHIRKPPVDIAGGQKGASSRKHRSMKGMRRHCNMIAVLEWLKGKNEECAIEEALKWIEQKRREKIKQALLRSLNAYRRCEMGSKSPEEHDDVEITNSSGTNDIISASNPPDRDVNVAISNAPGDDVDITAVIRKCIRHLNLPDWITNEYIDGEFPSPLLQIRQDRLVMLGALVEDFSKPSVYDCCRSLRAAVYHILLKNEPSEKRLVTEYSRDGLQFVKRPVDIEEDRFTSLPDLKGIETMEISIRQSLFLDFFHLSTSDLEVIGTFPPFLTPFATCFIFYCRLEDTEVEQCHVWALLVCVFWLCSKRNRSGGNRSGDGDEEVNFNHFIPESTEDQFRRVELEFDHTPSSKSKRDNALELSHLHAFGQWQACFQATQWLEAVLMRPFGRTAPVQFLFHGRVLYNLAVYLQKAKSVDSAVQHVFDGSTTLITSFMKTWTLLEPLVPPSKPHIVPRKPKRRRPKKSEGGTSINFTEHVDSDRNSDEGDLKALDDQWGLENRFRTLLCLK